MLQCSMRPAQEGSAALPDLEHEERLGNGTLRTELRVFTVLPASASALMERNRTPSSAATSALVSWHSSPSRAPV